MAISTNTEAHAIFKVMNQAAVDLANHTAVASVDTDIDVEMGDGEDQNPLKSGDLIIGPFPAAAGAGIAALEAGIAVVSNVYKDANTITMRTTNPSAGAINPASIAANAIYWLVVRF